MVRLLSLALRLERRPHSVSQAGDRDGESGPSRPPSLSHSDTALSLTQQENPGAVRVGLVHSYKHLPNQPQKLQKMSHSSLSHDSGTVTAFF